MKITIEKNDLSVENIINLHLYYIITKYVNAITPEYLTNCSNNVTNIFMIVVCYHKFKSITYIKNQIYRTNTSSFIF
jgi:hypothetical protein